MEFSQRFWRGLVFLSLITALCGGMAVPMLAPVRAAPLMQGTSCVGTTITQWTFAGDVVTPSTGAGTYSVGTGLPATTFAAGVTDRAVTYNNWPLAFDNFAYIELLVSTLGRNSIGVTFDYRSTGTGPTTLELHYSTDGTIFTLHAAPITLNNNGAFHSLSFDLSTIMGLNDNPNATFRLYGYGATAAGGTLRFDNITFIGNCLFPAPTSTPTGTSTPTATGSATSTPTNTGSPTNTSPPPATGIVISEFRTRGLTSGDDEFIELYNPTSAAISIAGWIIKKSSGCGTTPSQIATIPSAVSLAPGQHYLIGGGAYSGTVAANQSNSLSIADNGGIALFLPDGTTIVDQVGLCSSTLYKEGTALAPITVNGNRSYDRRSSPSGICIDSNNNAADFISRSPSDPQNLSSTLTACGNPTQTPTATPIRTATPRPSPTRTLSPPPPPPLVAINEFVPRPGHDWNNDGVVNVEDEYVELINHGTIDVNLSGYSLDDEVNIGSSPYALPAITISPGERVVFYGSETGLLLSDGGDGVRLLSPNGQLTDAYNYRVVRFPDQSFCRLPDNGGLDDWNTNCFPTPGLQNALSGSFVGAPNVPDAESQCPIADTLPIDFILAECPPFGNNIWRASYWDEPGWYGEKYLPESPGKWQVFAD